MDYNGDSERVLVTVITPCYNASLYLAETIQSVLQQTLADIEYIVVDDGSTDASAHVACQFSDPRLRVVRQSNAGVSAARNAGYRHASDNSVYVLWLDADDVLEPTMLEVMVGYLTRHPQAGFVFCNRQHINPFGEPVRLDWQPRRLVPGHFFPRELPALEAKTPFSSLFAQDALCNPSSTLIRRSVYAEAAGWDETFTHGEDWDLFFQLALLSEAHYLPAKLVRYRIGHAGQSTANMKLARAQYVKLYQKWERTRDAVVTQAMRFRDGQVLPAQWLTWSFEAACELRFVDALKCGANMARALGTYAVRSLDGTYR
jgi:glycosyltransferase involved in cell wall biosynthesis